MANKGINDFALKTTPVGTDEIVIQETGGGTTKKALVSALQNANIATYLSEWYLSVTFSGINSTSLQNWVEVSDGLLTPLGTSMTYNTGIFQFPTTGLWEVSVHGHIIKNVTTRWNKLKIQACLDYSTGPTWEDQGFGTVTCIGHWSWWPQFTMNSKTGLRITDTVEQRVQFAFDGQVSIDLIAGKENTFVTFKRISD